MRFKDFVTKQRITILVVGIVVFIISLNIAKYVGVSSLWSELYIDLAVSAMTIVFTALIIDYLGVKEQSNKTKAAADLAEEEIKAICHRIKWRMSRLFGLEQDRSIRDKISSKEEAMKYLHHATQRVENFLSSQDFESGDSKIDEKSFPRYIDRIQVAQTELEQTLILYEYAMSYSLREHVLGLRSELLVTERLLGFIDTSESLNEANKSLIRLTAKSVYQEVEAVLGHDSVINIESSIGNK